MRGLLLFFFSHRLLAIFRWEFHFLILRLWNSLTGVSRRTRAFVLGRKLPTLLNLGSGPRGIDDGHWINVDGFPNRNVHFVLDITRPLPFPDSAVDGVFSEHVFEHFSFDEGRAIAAELRRLLKSGGSLRIIVPDGERIMRAYFDEPKELRDRRGIEGATAMEVVNDYFRQRYEHQFLYDWPTLEKLLKEAGFADIARRHFGESGYGRELLLDDAKYKWESLYVEATKI